MGKNLKMFWSLKIKQSLKLTMLLLISLTAASCAHKSGAPIPPRVDLRQPIIDTKVCDSDGENCYILNTCKLWRVNNKLEWYLVENMELKKCNGIFGVTVDDFTKLRDYSRKLEKWIGRNCGPTNNRKSSSGNKSK